MLSFLKKYLICRSLGLALLASYSDGDDSEDDDLPNENQKNSLQVNIHGLSGTTL